MSATISNDSTLSETERFWMGSAEAVQNLAK